MDEFILNTIDEYLGYIIILTIFDMVLRLIALWKSVNLKQPAWFICIAIFPTCGILPGIYLIKYRKIKFPGL